MRIPTPSAPPNPLAGLAGPAARGAVRLLGALALPAAMYGDYLLWQAGQAAQPGTGWSHARYSKVFTCGRGHVRWRGNSPLSCNSNATEVTWLGMQTWPPPGTINISNIEPYSAVSFTQPSGSIIYRTDGRYTRIASGTTGNWVNDPGVPAVEPGYIPGRIDLPGYMPAIDPISIPVAVPGGFVTPAPRPVPHRVIPKRRPNPYRDPREQPSRSNGVKKDAATRPVVVSPRNPAPGIKVTATAGRHRVRPPRKGEKEHKASLGGPGEVGGPLQAIHRITETADAVSAIHAALPKRCRQKKNPSNLDKFNEIYRCKGLGPDFIVAAINNLRDEAVNDRLFGRLGRLTKTANQQLHSASGGKLFKNRGRGIATGPAL